MFLCSRLMPCRGPYGSVRNFKLTFRQTDWHTKWDKENVIRFLFTCVSDKFNDLARSFCSCPTILTDLHTGWQSKTKWDRENVLHCYLPVFLTSLMTWRGPCAPGRRRTGSSRRPAPASAAATERTQSGSASASGTVTGTQVNEDLEEIKKKTLIPEKGFILLYDQEILTLFF